MGVVASYPQILAPDCGMKYLQRASAFGKLQAGAKAAAMVRRELA